MTTIETHIIGGQRYALINGTLYPMARAEHAESNGEMHVHSDGTVEPEELPTVEPKIKTQSDILLAWLVGLKEAPKLGDFKKAMPKLLGLRPEDARSRIYQLERQKLVKFVNYADKIGRYTIHITKLGRQRLSMVDAGLPAPRTKRKARKPSGIPCVTALWVTGVLEVRGSATKDELRSAAQAVGLNTATLHNCLRSLLKARITVDGAGRYTLIAPPVAMAV